MVNIRHYSFTSTCPPLKDDLTGISATGEDSERAARLLFSVDCLMSGSRVSIQYHRVTDKQTNTKP